MLTEDEIQIHNEPCECGHLLRDHDDRLECCKCDCNLFDVSPPEPDDEEDPWCKSCGHRSTDHPQGYRCGAPLESGECCDCMKFKERRS